jgi:hypothetical protein
MAAMPGGGGFRAFLRAGQGGRFVAQYRKRHDRQVLGRSGKELAMRGFASRLAPAATLLGLLGLLLLPGGCSTAKVNATGGAGAAAAARPDIVYVTDFELSAAGVTAEPGLLGARPRLGILPNGILPNGPLAGLRQRNDPAAEARHVVDLMAETLVADLGKAGLRAERLPAGMPLPSTGWLVRGAFLQVDQGNRLRRAIIGFGAGATELQVATAVDDLAKGTPAAFYEVETGAKSRNLPGAVVTLNPYVAAARFVLAGQDLDRNVKDSAAEIAKSVVARVRNPG